MLFIIITGFLIENWWILRYKRLRTNVPDNKGQEDRVRGLFQINTTYFTTLPRASLGVKVREEIKENRLFLLPVKYFW